MSFLDRFKPQPRWKHADPAARAAAVPEIPADPEHRSVIEDLATGDDDVRVRAAAIARLDDVSLLARLARSERDEDLRRGITDRLVAIAKSSPHDTVRAAALGRIHDARALGSVARHAEDRQTALEAVGRVGDPAELLNVALKTDHKDAGIAALEKCVDTSSPDARDTLETVSIRAKNKSIAKRARAMLQAIEDAEVARRAALEHWQQRIAGILARVEALAAAPATMDAAER